MLNSNKTKRTVPFPLKFKLLSVMIVLISASLIVFVSIALSTFKQDKSAYIYETLLNKASSGDVLLSQKLQQAGPGALSVEDGELSLGKEPAQKILDSHMPENSSYEFSLIIPKQNIFYRWHQGELTQLSADEAAVFSPILDDSIREAVREIEREGEKWILAYSYNPEQNYAFVSALPQSEAFAVTRYLVNKSLLYGLLILGVAMILSVLLAKPLTSSLEKVHDLTREIASGNFQKRIQVNSRDEVADLANSVNHMADQIVVYIEEMKEKARLENEVSVAQLVQSSFFPPPTLRDENIEIHGHFEPASECGGDWWGVYEHDEWKIIFIADATGHGVPAALLTSTINCCKTSLGFIIETKPEILKRPDEILRYMNQAVCGAGKEIQVTCFVATLNKKTLEFHYSNASHTPPLLFNSASGEVSKDDFQPLMQAKGPRLGQTLATTYPVESLHLKSNDTILFYTDGLTEAENAEGQRWGERRLIKNLIATGNKSPENLISDLLAEFRSFSPDRPKDDITVVAMKVLT